MRKPAADTTAPEAADGDPWGRWAATLLDHALAADSDDGATAAAQNLAAAEAGIDPERTAHLPLAGIAAWTELDALSTRVLALCAAVECDRRLQHLADHLTGTPGAGRLTVDLLCRLLGAAALGTLHDDAPLNAAALLDIEQGVPFAAAHLAVPAPVCWALLGQPNLGEYLPPDVEIVSVPAHQIGTADTVLVAGPDRVRRVEAAATATTGLDFLLCAPPDTDSAWRNLVRQAGVSAAGLILECTEPPTARTRRWLERAAHLPVALTSAEPLPAASLPRRAPLEITPADPAVTPAEWAAVFPDAPLPARPPAATLLHLAARMPGAATDPAAALARAAAGTLHRHATRVDVRKTWNDLVLPPAQSRQLRALVERYRRRDLVHRQWGLPLYPSPGIVAMFAGPSGTGKTTAAEVIAHELGVELFRIDLSALVSKYIGETEQNLEAVFSAAHARDGLLLFDEADALFGSRSKVTDARDRYANMEVSYLLQRLETFDGFVILTSNFQGNIDDAFLRRIHVTVHFEVPAPGDRRLIWEGALGAAPRAEVDLDFVAEKFDLTGGSIRLAALSAAFLAAAQDRPVEMVDVLAAVSSEMTKLRRRPSDDQFGPWLAALRAAEEDVIGSSSPLATDVTRAALARSTTKPRPH